LRVSVSKTGKILWREILERLWFSLPSLAHTLETYY
jgi:hypothetical protein